MPEDDQYELCELLHPAGTTYRPCSTVRTHPSPSERDETDGDDERPPPLLARVRRLLRTRAPLLPPRVSRSPPPCQTPPLPPIPDIAESSRIYDPGRRRKRDNRDYGERVSI